MMLRDPKIPLASAPRESVHGQVELCSREDKEHHGRSTRDGNRAFAQAEDESTPGTLSGAVWRRITVFESRVPVSADCLALAGEGTGRSERAGAEASGGTGR